ncbi:hypothetical protein AYI68_g7290, partial [Smittium mucronatum]
MFKAIFFVLAIFQLSVLGQNGNDNFGNGNGPIDSDFSRRENGRCFNGDSFCTSSRSNSYLVCRRGR